MMTSDVSKAGLNDLSVTMPSYIWWFIILLENEPRAVTIKLTGFTQN